MADYLAILWDWYIMKQDLGVHTDEKIFEERFWNTIGEVWAQFKEHMETSGHDFAIELLCATKSDKEGNEGEEELDPKDKATCELVLRALYFKHAISGKWDLTGTGATDPGHREQGQDEVGSYMKCVLVNIFLKRIIGHTCLNTEGGNLAFRAAEALVKEGDKKQPNMTCEEQDMQHNSGIRGDPGKWDLWRIMERWLDRNRTRLHDGKQGVLGEDCEVKVRHKGAESVPYVIKVSEEEI
ncbi:hypothetical protein AK88_04302 [Plasmodium fragile]|uniref:Schizont-infected cell agglutination extracellular alpha domain-containing protein n=1 Tax=Plasmodium fragile TaxID=5857 RepID=A0A0D9QG54_PLAFR|nr:uncharacterized protein AK88_04302 [Plasmodium fragile]KJP86045.1 hypothetical protein AK88_04302 [Plasmodium fragile]